MTVPGRRPAAAGGQADPFATPARSNEAMFEIDLTGVTTGPSWQIPVGVHPAKLVDVQRGTSQAGNNKLVWILQIIGGASRGKQQQFHTALTQPAMWKVGETVEALGLGESGGRLTFSQADAIGRVCAVVVEEQIGRDNISRPQISRLVHWGEFADDPVFIETAERLGLIFESDEEGEAAPAATPARETARSAGAAPGMNRPAVRGQGVPR